MHFCLASYSGQTCMCMQHPLSETHCVFGREFSENQHLTTQTICPSLHKLLTQQAKNFAPDPRLTVWVKCWKQILTSYPLLSSTFALFAFITADLKAHEHFHCQFHYIIPCTFNVWLLSLPFSVYNNHFQYHSHFLSFFLSFFFFQCTSASSFYFHCIITSTSSFGV